MACRRARCAWLGPVLLPTSRLSCNKEVIISSWSVALLYSRSPFLQTSPQLFRLHTSPSWPLSFTGHCITPVAGDGTAGAVFSWQQTPRVRWYKGCRHGDATSAYQSKLQCCCHPAKRGSSLYHTHFPGVNIHRKPCQGRRKI